MTTVGKDHGKKDVPAFSKITSDSGAGSSGYVRPTAGGSASGDNVPASPGVVPGAGAYSPNLAGNVPANVDISGAAIVAPVAQPHGTGAKAGDVSGGGTVGDSGPQGG